MCFSHKALRPVWEIIAKTIRINISYFIKRNGYVDKNSLQSGGIGTAYQVTSQVVTHVINAQHPEQ